MTRARDVADTQDNIGGAVSPVVAGKNFVINGGFDWWQRGTSFTNPSSIYTSDRWVNATNGAVFSQQSSGAPTGSRFYMRSITNTSGAFCDIAHYFETNQIAPLWGRTVTLSFRLRKSGVAFAGAYIVNLQRSSTVDAGSGASWTTVSGITVATENIALGTSSSDWSTFSFTTTIPNDGTANSLRIVGGYGITQASGVVIDIAQFQLELGNVATPFSRAAGTIQGELAACQRYYYRTNGTQAGSPFGFAHCFGSTVATAVIPYPVPMRVTPAGLEQSGTATDYRVYLSSGAAQDCSFVPQQSGIGNTRNQASVFITVAANLVGGQVTVLAANNTNAFLGWSAEL